MNKSEAREANTLHAIWDIIVMHHSIESAKRTYEITVSDIELIIAKLRVINVRHVKRYMPQLNVLKYVRRRIFIQLILLTNCLIWEQSNRVD